jgi:hypothetical protein
MSMQPITYSAETWAEIRQRYEAGETAGKISKSLGGSPSKVAINKRARKEGWTVITRLSDKYPALANGNPIIDIDKLGQDLPENRAVIVALLGEGCSYKLAASAVGISDRTLRDWREKDPAFAAKCQAARAADMAEVMASIKRMAKTDFNAAKFRAERDPLTRDEYGTAANRGGILGTTINVLGHVNVGIERSLGPIEDAPIIDGEVLERT